MYGVGVRTHKGVLVFLRNREKISGVSQGKEKGVLVFSRNREKRYCISQGMAVLYFLVELMIILRCKTCSHPINEVN